MSTVNEGGALNVNSGNVGCGRTPIVDTQGSTKLILPDSSIYRQASDLHGKLANNIATFSTQGMTIIPAGKVPESDPLYDIYKLGEGRLGAQTTIFFDTGSDSNYCLLEFAEAFKFKEVGPPQPTVLITLANEPTSLLLRSFLIPVLQADGSERPMVFKGIQDMGREAHVPEKFKIEFKKQLRVSQACEDFYFGEGNRIDLLIGARTCENITKIAAPSEFGYHDPLTSPNIRLAEISTYPNSRLMVMGSLGIFRKILDQEIRKKVDLPRIKLIMPKKRSKSNPLSRDVEHLMKTCDKNDELIPLASSGVHNLILDGMSYINGNIVDLADILPPVIAPSLDYPENCFFVPRGNVGLETSPRVPIPKEVGKEELGSKQGHVVDSELGSKTNLPYAESTVISNKGQYTDTSVKPKSHDRQGRLRSCQCMHFTKNMHRQVQEFIAQENAVTINPPQCEHHRNISCSLCKALASDTCLKDREAYLTLLENMELKTVGGVPELHAKYVYNVDPQVTFKAENSNFQAALRAAISTANRLIRLDPTNFEYLDQYQKEIDKAVTQGHLKLLSEQQREE